MHNLLNFVSSEEKTTALKVFQWSLEQPVEVLEFNIDILEAPIKTSQR